MAWSRFPLGSSHKCNCHSLGGCWFWVFLQVSLFDQENFQGQQAVLTGECLDLGERGFERVRSVIVDSGP